MNVMVTYDRKHRSLPASSGRPVVHLMALAILIVLAVVQPHIGYGGAVGSSPDVLIDMVMSHAGIAGLQAVVVKNGKTVWSKSFGYAVLDQPGPRRPMRMDTNLDTASVGKLLVTIAVFQQVEKGRLALDDDINRSVPFAVRNPAWPDVPITWRMLLSHTGSFQTEPDEITIPLTVYGKDPNVSFDEFIEETFSATGRYKWEGKFTSSKPGTQRVYSNLGFTLMAYALERIAHESFDAYVQRSILDPLRMRNTFFTIKGPDPARFGVQYISLRQENGSYAFVPNKTYWAHADPGGSVMEHLFNCVDYPSGCIHSSAEDFARILLMLMNGGTLDGARILAPTSIELMATPTAVRNLDGWQQGLGLLGPEDLRGRVVWGHDGENLGTSTALFFNRSTGVGAVIFANSTYPDYSQTYAIDDLNMHLLSFFE